MASNEVGEIFSFSFFLVFSIFLFLVEVWSMYVVCMEFGLSGMKGSV